MNIENIRGVATTKINMIMNWILLSVMIVLEKSRLLVTPRIAVTES